MNVDIITRHFLNCPSRRILDVPTSPRCVLRHLPSRVLHRNDEPRDGCDRPIQPNRPYLHPPKHFHICLWLEDSRYVNRKITIPETRVFVNISWKIIKTYRHVIIKVSFQQFIENLFNSDEVLVEWWNWMNKFNILVRYAYICNCEAKSRTVWRNNVDTCWHVGS